MSSSGSWVAPVPVLFGDADGQWNAMTIDDQVMLRAEFAANPWDSGPVAEPSLELGTILDPKNWLGRFDLIDGEGSVMLTKRFESTREPLPPRNGDKFNSDTNRCFNRPHPRSTSAREILVY